MNERLFNFVGGEIGPWHIVQFNTLIGQPLPHAQRLNIVRNLHPIPSEGASWSLRGLTSNERYTTSSEKAQLLAIQPGLGRPQATCAALIPIRKSPSWWRLAQDERRKIFEDSSHHIAKGLNYLPAVARRLHHCRDLGENEPFDFLTWFEYAPSDATAFEQLLLHLRASEEWAYVEREIDIRLIYDGPH